MQLKTVRPKQVSTLQLHDGYAASDQTFFGGRESETKEIIKRLGKDPSILIYGKAKIGKSSTITANVIPAMRLKGWAPVIINDYKKPFLSISNAINQGVGKKNQFAPKRTNSTSKDEILNYLVKLSKVKKIVFFFDQLEHLFYSQAENEITTSAFFNFINKLLLSTAPNTRFIFSIRENYIKHLSATKLNINMEDGLKFQALNRVSAKKTIITLLSAHSVSIRNDVLNKILNDLAELEFEPVLINILTNELLTLSINRGMGNIKISLVEYQQIGELEGLIYKQLNLLLINDHDIAPSTIKSLVASLINEKSISKLPVINDMRKSLVSISKQEIQTAYTIILEGLATCSLFIPIKKDGLNDIKLNLINQSLSKYIAKWFNSDNNIQKFKIIKKIISASVSLDIWQQNPSIYLSRDKLDFLATSEHKKNSFTEVEIRFLFESAVYRKSQSVVFLMRLYGKLKAIDFLKKCLLSQNGILQIRAAQAIYKLSQNNIDMCCFADYLINISLSKTIFEIRNECAKALALVHNEKQIAQLKDETTMVYFGFVNFGIVLIQFIMNQFLSKTKSFYIARNRSKRALDILIAFHSEGIKLTNFKWFLRHKTLSHWLKRAVFERRQELYDWAHQGRIIGVSSVFKWFISFGTILFLVISNNFYLDKYRDSYFSISLVFSALVPLLVLSVFFGRSMAKTAFIKHELKLNRNWYRYIFKNPLYNTFLTILLISSLLLSRQFNTIKIEYFIFGPLFFWLLIPLTLYLLNSINFRFLQHSKTLSGKAFIGSSGILLIGLGLGLFLNKFYTDANLFFLFIALGSITSAIFMIIYSTLTFLIARNTPKTTTYKKYEILISKLANMILIAGAVFAVIFSFVSVYGIDAIGGSRSAEPMNYNNESKTYSVKNSILTGPDDANYFEFELFGDDPLLLVIPENKNASQFAHPYTELLIDGFNKIDLKYSAGESFIISSGKHFVVIKAKGKQKMLAMTVPDVEFQVHQIKDNTLTKVADFPALTASKTAISKLKPRFVYWYRASTGDFWYTDIRIASKLTASELRVRILKDSYSLDSSIIKSLSAQLWTDIPSEKIKPTPINILKPNPLELVPNEKFYFFEPKQFIIHQHKNGGTSLRLFLSSKNIAADVDTIKSVLFIDIFKK